MIITWGRRCVYNCVISSCICATCIEYPYMLPRGARYKSATKRKHRLIVIRRYDTRCIIHACIYNDFCHTRRGEKTSGAKAQEWCLFPSILFQGEQRNLHHLVSSSEMALQRQTIFSRSGNKSRSRSPVRFANPSRSNVETISFAARTRDSRRPSSMIPSSSQFHSDERNENGRDDDAQGHYDLGYHRSMLQLKKYRQPTVLSYPENTRER